MPSAALRACRRMELVGSACPRRVPQAETYSTRAIERAGLGYETFNLESGTASAEPSRNRPPAFVHIVVEAGDLEDAFQTLVFPLEGTPVRARDGVVRLGREGGNARPRASLRRLGDDPRRPRRLPLAGR
ncbi:MAG: hypothetical protein ACRDON_07850 [Gaiellaceae bacterium]